MNWLRRIFARERPPEVSHLDIRPGDYIVMTLHNAISLETAERMKAQLEAFIPAVKVIVLSEDANIKILRWLIRKLTGDIPKMPERIQLRRSAGWRMPAGTIKVDRSTRWGNPFRASALMSSEAVTRLYEDWICGRLSDTDPALFDQAGAPPAIAEIRAKLRGKHLACWCSLTQPYCHAEVLLRLANGG